MWFSLRGARPVAFDGDLGFFSVGGGSHASLLHPSGQTEAKVWREVRGRGPAVVHTQPFRAFGVCAEVRRKEGRRHHDNHRRPPAQACQGGAGRRPSLKSRHASVPHGLALCAACTV